PRPPLKGRERGSPSERISFQQPESRAVLVVSSSECIAMANVRVEQRNAHLAGPVRLEYVNGREGKVAKATITVISNNRRGSGEDREEEATSLMWTLWGRQAENAAEYLGKGSHVNVAGRVRNNNYRNAEGAEVYGLAFTVEEIDYLDSRAESEARRARSEGGAAAPAAVRKTLTPPPDGGVVPAANGRTQRPRQRPQA
ncbi:single-stranded DNA-binding protein, partial [Rubrivivax gelatinosus]